MSDPVTLEKIRDDICVNVLLRQFTHQLNVRNAENALIHNIAPKIYDKAIVDKFERLPLHFTYEGGPVSDKPGSPFVSEHISKGNGLKVMIYTPRGAVRHFTLLHTTLDEKTGKYYDRNTGFKALVFKDDDHSGRIIVVNAGNDYNPADNRTLRQLVTQEKINRQVKCQKKFLEEIYADENIGISKDTHVLFAGNSLGAQSSVYGFTSMRHHGYNAHLFLTEGFAPALMFKEAVKQMVHSDIRNISLSEKEIQRRYLQKAVYLSDYITQIDVTPETIISNWFVPIESFHPWHIRMPVTAERFFIHATPRPWNIEGIKRHTFGDHTSKATLELIGPANTTITYKRDDNYCYSVMFDDALTKNMHPLIRPVRNTVDWMLQKPKRAVASFVDLVGKTNEQKNKATKSATELIEKKVEEGTRRFTKADFGRA